MNLKEWLERIQAVHVTDMDLSLERVVEVAKRLNVLETLAQVVTVGGTNGKGSCVAGLEAIYLTAGYRVGAFTSPILIRHNEYIRINGKEVSDEAFCTSFERIEQARGDITLTPFEFNALAAFDIFQKEKLDIWILEVGLGGRFDAVNAVDADVAIVASIGIDHVEWLGNTREAIGFEKAGIFRKGQPAVCGDFEPPMTLRAYADQIGAHWFCQNEQFGFEKKSQSWNWWSVKQRLEHLPLPHLALQNMASVLMAVELLQENLPVTAEIISQALAQVSLTGRIQVIPGDVPKIFDVSHNPASAEFLVQWLKENPVSGKTHAVFSMLGDKDILTTILVVKELIDEWHIASLATKRAASLQKLMGCFQQAEITNMFSYDVLLDGYQKAVENAQSGDRVVVFGSFHTVAEVLG